MRMHSIHNWRAIVSLLILPLLAFSVVAQQTNSLTIPGQTGSARVIQVGGRNYVEVESLARITNSSLSFKGNQIVLNLPGVSSDSSSSASTTASVSPGAGFSKDFLTAGIEAMAQIREWHAALKNAIERGTPVSDDWLAAYRNQAQQALRFAAVAVNTSSDKNALPLLTNEFNFMGKLTDKYVLIANSRSYIPLDSLNGDALDEKIRTCGRSLASMATANQIVDDGSCSYPIAP
jgi:hypothetical protein